MTGLRRRRQPNPAQPTPRTAPTSRRLREAFAASGAALACLCGSDEIYASDAAEAARMLRAAGAKQVYLAGRPGEREAALRAAGIGAFIYVGCDVVEALAGAHAVLGLPCELRL